MPTALVAEPLTTVERRSYLLHCLGLFGLAFALRLWGLASQSLWLDEVLQFNMSKLPLGEMLRVVCTSDNHPPLYHTVLHYVIAAGGATELWLRLPSALFGSVAVVLIYVIARQLGQVRTALGAGLLLAVSPLHVWYSQEARLYSLMVMLVLASTALLLRAVQRPSLGSWGLYALSAAAGLYTYLYVVLSWLGYGCWLLLDARRRREALKPWLLASIGAVLLFVPWLLPFLQRDAFVAGLEKSVSPVMALAYTFLTFLAGYSVGPSVAQLHVSRDLAIFLPHLPLMAAYGLLGVGVVGAALTQWRNERETLSLSACLVLCPVLGALAIAEAIPSITYNVRYPLAAVPFLCLGIAAGLVRLRPWLRTALFAALLVLSGLSLWRGYGLPEYAKEDNRSAAEYVAQMARAGDGLVLQSDVTFEHYFPRHDLVSHALRRGLSEDERVSMARTWARQHHSLWLVECRSWTVDPSGVVRRTLGELMRTERQADFTGVRVTHYVR